MTSGGIRVALGLGSNLPVRERHLDAAVEGLSEFLADIEESRRYETLPRYRAEQPRFLNSVVLGYTTESPEQVLARIHAIEARRGRDRVRSGWMGPRPLDIDILLYGDAHIDGRELTIPHPRMYERKFVLLPLLSLDPTVEDPISGRPFFEFFTKLDEQGIYYYSLDEFETTWV